MEAGACSLVAEIYSLVFCSLVMVLGVPGNCLILRVYWSKTRTTSTRVLIMGLAWADLAACAFLVFRIVASCFFGKQMPIEYTNITDYLLYTAVGTSAVITSAIAFDRYDSVCRPRRRLLNDRRALAVAVCCAVYDGTVNFPVIVELFQPTPLTEIIILAFQIIAYVAALLLIVVCYGKVYSTIRQHVKVGMLSGQASGHQNTTDPTTSASTIPPGQLASQLASQTSTGSQGVSSNSVVKTSQAEVGVHLNISKASSSNTATHDSGVVKSCKTNAPSTGVIPPSRLQRPVTNLQRKTTKMLLITSVVFLVSWLPRWVFVALQLLEVRGAVVAPGFRLAVAMSAPLFYVNHVVNPFIYGLANSRFREDCKKELKKRCF